MARNKKIQLTEEEIYIKNIISTIKEIREDFSRIGQSPNERKRFALGESVFVQNGGFMSAVVIGVIEEDIYEIEVTYSAPEPYKSEGIVRTRKRILGWYDVFKTQVDECDIKLGEDLRLNFMQQHIISLIESYIISFGVDFNPSYQRGLVWKLEDEQKLIESVFDRVDIGKFVFIHLGYEKDLMYEILDGKQRLTALYRFYTDQFKYKGYYYSELPYKLKHVFEDSSVAVACTRKEDMKEKDILNYFLKLNTTGKPVDSVHINKIREIFNKL